MNVAKWTAVGLSLTAGSVPAKPNVVLFFADDLGWGDVGYNGNTYHLTPNIDSFAKESQIFSEAYAYPTCSPSRACLITGQNAPRHGIYRVPEYKPMPEQFKRIKDLPSGEFYDGPGPTIGDVMKKAGYFCGYIGKWHLGDRPETLPPGRGFDVNIAGYKYGAPPSYFSPYNNPELLDGPPGEYLPERLARESSEFIEQNKHHSFFLIFAPHLVHRPLQPKPEYVELFKDRTPWEGHSNPDYAAMVYALDVEFGTLIHALKTAGVYDNTLIVLLSDNGTNPYCASGAPLRGYKASVYEGGVRVPMIVHWQGITLPGTCDVPVTVMDMLPTFMDAAGFSMPGLTLDGESLLPLIHRTGTLQRDALYWYHPCYDIPTVFAEGVRSNFAYWADGEVFMPPENKRGDWVQPCSVINSDGYKLIWKFDTGELELYNLEKDPGETANLAAAEPEKADALKKKLATWLNKMHAVIPSEPNPDYDPTYHTP